MSERPLIGKSRLKADLEKMGIVRGDHVAVALSFKSIGFFEGGPDGFIDSLLEAVGSEGTVMMNTFTLSYPLTELPRDYVFDPRFTVPYTGLVPRTLMKREAAIRSRHPTCSVVAIGGLSRYLTDDHNEHSLPYRPYAKLAIARGKLLCIGLDDRLVALRHEAQRRAGLFVVPQFMGVRYRNLKGEVELFVWKFPPCNRRLSELVPEMERKGIATRGKIGEAQSIIGSAADLLENMSSILREDATLNLCFDFSCLSCRELERRMNLYGRIRNPRFFQKSMFIRRLLKYRNGLELRRCSRVSCRNVSSRRKIHPSYLIGVGIYRFVWVISKILK